MGPLAAVLFAAAALAVGSAQAPDQVTSRDVDLKAPDGIVLKATYFSTPAPGPGIMLLHMCGDGGRKAWAHLAQLLAARGFHVLTLDYRGYGESGGERFETADAGHWSTMQQMWPGDFDLAFQYLMTQPGVNPQHAGAGGASCGAGNAAGLAVRHPEVRSLVLLSGGLTESGLEYLRRSDRLPVFAAASDDDFGFVPYLRWVMLFTRDPRSTLVTYARAGHGTDMFRVQTDLEPRIADWFAATLLKPPGEAKAVMPVQPGSQAELDFWSTVTGPGGAAAALKAFEEAKRRDAGVVLFPLYAVMSLGYEHLGRGDVSEAIRLFRLDVAAYPASCVAYHNLAEGYLRAGDRSEALKATERALELLDKDTTINDALRTMIRTAAERRRQPATRQDEVRDAERAFAQTMADRNLEAFTSFLDEEAVFLGAKGPARGRQAVADAWKPFFAKPQAPFSWEPTLVEVLASGTLALTSGPVRDPSGKRVGIFNSIWRRQPDGTWRVVFDKGCQVCDQR